jgi:hypothetical protein
MGPRLQGAGFALTVVLVSAASAQAPPNQEKPTNLEFLFQPDAIELGVPRAFIFLLVNRTDHEVRVPVPTFSCSDSFNGFVSLSRNFIPKGSPEPSQGSGCFGDGPFGVPITERIEKWQILASGFALALRVDPEKIGWKIMRPSDTFAPRADQEHVAQAGMHPYLYLYDNSKAGDYEFWATYSPPSISLSDQKVLQGLGIDFPRPGKLATNHASFVRE